MSKREQNGAPDANGPKRQPFLRWLGRKNASAVGKAREAAMARTDEGPRWWLLAALSLGLFASMEIFTTPVAAAVAAAIVATGTVGTLAAYVLLPRASHRSSRSSGTSTRASTEDDTSHGEDQDAGPDNTLGISARKANPRAPAKDGPSGLARGLLDGASRALRGRARTEGPLYRVVAVYPAGSEEIFATRTLFLEAKRLAIWASRLNPLASFKVSRIEAGTDGASSENLSELWIRR